MSDSFELVSPYSPAGDQPDAIAKLTSNFEAGIAKQTLLGVGQELVALLEEGLLDALERIQRNAPAGR